MGLERKGMTRMDLCEIQFILYHSWKRSAFAKENTLRARLIVHLPLVIHPRKISRIT